jgi:very-short-patch-repair endonuclease
MKQVSKKDNVKKVTKSNKVTRKPTHRHKLPGTSKLEERFAKDFLERLGVKYIYQFEVKEIGRWYDFYLPDHNLIIEVDGSYYHADPRVVTEDKLKPMHKRNMRVDEYKTKWALAHGIPIMRIWEKDINESPTKVFEALKKRLGLEKEKAILTEKKNKRHVNKIK